MRDSFVFYKTFLDTAKYLEDADRLAFYDALVAFGIEGAEVAESPIILALMESVKQAILSAEKKYLASVENGKKGGRPKAKDGEMETQEKPKKTQGKPKVTQGKARLSDGNPEEPNPNLNVDVDVNVDVNDDVNVNVDDDVNGDKRDKCKQPKVAHRTQAFTPPTVTQVSDYCQARGNQVDPSKFVDFYASKGWMVGKNKMKDWEACVRTWEKQDAEFGRQVPRGASNPETDNVFLGMLAGEE